MTKNNRHNIINCLLIANDTLESTLAGIFTPQQENIRLEVVANQPASIIQSLIKRPANLLFVAASDTKQLDAYKKLLIRYSVDTLLIYQSDHYQPLKRSLSGVETAGLPLQSPTDQEEAALATLLNNLARYSQLKKDFRLCKHFLSITDQRNRWLVNITPEPIAYIYRGTHIHANAAYLSLFGFQSMAELKASTIDDLIPAKSRKMFQRFVQKQQRHALTDIQQTLLMPMTTIDNQSVRAAIRVAPAVLNKTRCIQLWVHKIEDNLDPSGVTMRRKKDETPASPWQELPQKKNRLHPSRPERSPARTPSLFPGLKDGLKSVQLKFQPLTDTNSAIINHYFVKLQFDVQEQQHINQILKTSHSSEAATFRDRLLITELIRRLQGKQQPNKHILLSLSAASLNDNAFIVFLIKKLSLLSDRHPQLVLLIPHSEFKQHPVRVKAIDRKIRSLGASLGIYNFIPDKQSVQKALRDKPPYISFSSRWTKKISTQPQQLERFTRLTEYMEREGIETILS